MPPARKTSHWFTLGWEAITLGLEASTVMATRLAILSGGGDRAKREWGLMFSEKVKACVELQTKLGNMGATATPQAAAQATLAHYRTKVAANLRRLRR